MNLPMEILIALNVAGWSLAFYLGKRQFDDLTRRLESLSTQMNTLVTRQECRDIHKRLHAQVDEMDAKVDRHGERLARVEVAAGKG